MKIRNVILFVVIACLWSGCQTPMKPTVRQAAKKTTITMVQEYRYLRYLPSGYADEREKHWPLVLFLHGAGERGSDLELIKKHGLPKLIEAGRDFPFVVISPQCPPGEWWNIFALEGLIEEAARELRIDRDRVYLTGLSMGGFGTWALAVRHPERYAAILPVCGGGERQLARTLRDVPVWAFHGDADPVVPVERSQEMIDAIRKLGGSPRLTVYPGVKHDSWTATYDNPEIYDWLLSHRLSDRTKSE
ncbi:MAG TPA: dienelactone hydrolase family protein [Opitutus sp.]|nr:dienelactone hydrolase family protein [Opitutus sp.]